MSRTRSDVRDLPGRFEICYGGQGIYLWAPQFALYGEGATVEDAADDLTCEIVCYVDDWFDHLHAAPNHRHRLTAVATAVAWQSDGSLAARMLERARQAITIGTGGDEGGPDRHRSQPA